MFTIFEAFSGGRPVFGKMWNMPWFEDSFWSVIKDFFFSFETFDFNSIIRVRVLKIFLNEDQNIILNYKFLT